MSDFRIKTCVLGPVSTNCYVICNEKTKEAVIVDPADHASRILDKCCELNVKPEAILLTHGHFDHIMAAKEVKEAFGCKIFAGRAEEKMLLDPGMNMSVNMGIRQISIHPDVLVDDSCIHSHNLTRLTLSKPFAKIVPISLESTVCPTK